MRILAGFLCLVVVVSSASPSLALRRQRVDHPFYDRAALSVYLGAGVAVGEFSSDKDGDGNHESGAFDWSAEIEYFATPGFSLGLNVTHSTWDDKDLPLETNISAFGGFLRYVIDTPGPVYPFLRFGIESMEVEFEDAFERFESEHAGAINVGGGGIAMLGRYVSLNASLLYTHGFTDDAQVGDAYEDEDGTLVVEIVGFDVQYWTFAAGVSVYFP
jgi:hypothetical protein